MLDKLQAQINRLQTAHRQGVAPQIEPKLVASLQSTILALQSEQSRLLTVLSHRKSSASLDESHVNQDITLSQLHARSNDNERVVRATQQPVNQHAAVTQLQRTVSALQRQVRDANERADTATAALSPLKSKISQLESQLHEQTANVQVEHADAQIVDEPQKENSKLGIQLSEAEDKAQMQAAAVRQNSQAEQRPTDVSRRCVKFETDLRGVEAQQKEIKNLKILLAQKDAQAAALRKKIDKLVTSRQNIATKNNRLAASRDALRKENAVLEETVKQIQEQLVEYRSKYVAGEKAVVTLEGVVKKASKERDDVFKKMEALRKDQATKKSEAEKNVVKLEAKVEKLKKELKKTVSSAVRSDPTALQELEALLSKSEKLAEAREKSRQVWKAKFDSCQQQLDSLKNQVEEAEKALQVEKSNTEKTNKAMEQAKLKLKDLEATKAANRLSTSLLQPTPTGALLSPAPLALLPMLSRKTTDATSESQSRFTDTLPFNVEDDSDLECLKDERPPCVEDASRDVDSRGDKCLTVSASKETTSILRRSSKRTSSSMWEGSQWDGKSIITDNVSASEASGSTSVYGDKAKSVTKAKQSKSKRQETRGRRGGGNDKSLLSNRKLLQPKIIRANSNETLQKRVASQDVMERRVSGRVLRARKPVSYNYDKQGRDIVEVLSEFGVDERALKRARI